LKRPPLYNKGSVTEEFIIEEISARGLVSSLDINAIIDGLTSLEMNKVRRIDKEKKKKIKSCF
jgi:hypothetical protein